ncbi:manganese/zinc/iron transport system permease protein [Salegentibacter echinorum]|uniref:Manganese/zinc/iron transport system permease protein n=1 Tax=Salegentibacter echinorum TaxID=1073325 RepID=A0A1M5M3H6_SALEC|nr:metal ABC transporter permease [Salegentibacter echinorum]SHG71882.1 manganese/zinc/iron transport system permease protein [Salegentibacter echinorum]
MTNAQLEIQIIAALVAVACAIPGTFLVLRKMAMISDAISHSILVGIVLGFFITQDLNSPLLILLAALTGIVTVVMVEYIQKTNLVKEDTAIGLVFPALFSIGVILIAKNANDVHLDIDAVLLGELAFAPFDRLLIGGMDIGPKSLWVIGVILFLTLLLLFLFYKELKLSTFDKGLAATLGFSPVILHYGLMSVSSVTIVGAFDAVGAVLVVALIIAPPATAYLLTDNLKKMLILSSFFGVFAAISGYWMANFLDASIAGSMTTVLGVIFLLVYLFAPRQGVFSVMFKEKQQQVEVSLLVFLLHLQNHTDPKERHVNHLQEHINWGKVKSKTILNLAKKNNFVTIDANIALLTPKGEEFTAEALKYITTNEETAIEGLKKRFFLFRG